MLNPVTYFHQKNTPGDSIESRVELARQTDPHPNPYYSGAFTEVAKRIGQLDFQFYAYTRSKLPEDALRRIFFEEYRLKDYVEKSAFTAKDWNTYFGDVGEEPPLPPDIFEILKSPCPFWPDKKVQDTHFLCLIPKTVNGIPLTLDSLEELVQTPKQGAPRKYDYYSGYVKAELGNKTPEYSHWVLMTKDVVPNSRSKTYDQQKNLVESIPNYKPPLALGAAVVILMHTFKTGRPIYTDDKLGPEWTYTRCEGRVNNSRSSAWIGGLSGAGLRAYYFLDFDRNDGGVGGFRKFH